MVDKINRNIIKKKKNKNKILGNKNIQKKIYIRKNNKS